MKRFLQLILFSLLTFSAYSQAYVQPNSTYGFTWNRGYFPIALHVPIDDTVLNTSKTASGALKFRTTGGDTTLYVWDSTGSRWRRAGGGGGSSGGTVTDVTSTLPIVVTNGTTTPHLSIHYVYTDSGYARLSDALRWDSGGTAGSVIGSDTSIYSTVIDSTGAPGQRVLFSGGNKIRSDSYFLYDSTSNKLVINHNNISVGDPNTKLFIQGNLEVKGAAKLETVVYTDTAIYKPMAIQAGGGFVGRMDRWPVVNDPGKLNSGDTAYLHNQLLDKIDSMRRVAGSLNVQARKNGTWITQFIDSVSAGGGSGVTTIGTINSQTKSLNGAVINGTDLVMQTVNPTRPGLIGTGLDTIAGVKRFNDNMILGSTKSITFDNSAAFAMQKRLVINNDGGQDYFIGSTVGSNMIFNVPTGDRFDFHSGSYTSGVPNVAQFSTATAYFAAPLSGNILSFDVASATRYIRQPDATSGHAGIGFMDGYGLSLYSTSNTNRRIVFNFTGDHAGATFMAAMRPSGFTIYGTANSVPNSFGSVKQAFQVITTTQTSMPSPAMTETARNALASPDTASTVYNTTVGGINIYNGANWTGSTVVSGAGTLTLAHGNYYVFTGSTTTWTLPAVSATLLGEGNKIVIKNRGSGAITLNSNTGSTLYTTAAVGTLTINAGEGYILYPDGTYFDTIK